MPWTQDGSGGLAYANGVTALIATRRTGRIGNANRRQVVTILHSIASRYPPRLILSSNFGFWLGPERRPARSGGTPNDHHITFPRAEGCWGSAARNHLREAIGHASIGDRASPWARGFLYEPLVPCPPILVDRRATSSPHISLSQARLKPTVPRAVCQPPDGHARAPGADFSMATIPGRTTFLPPPGSGSSWNARGVPGETVPPLKRACVAASLLIESVTL